MKIGLGIGIGSGGGAAPWTPLALGSSLALWLRADMGVTLNGATVSAWADQAPVAIGTQTQGVAISQPTYVASDATLGGQPSINFDGSNDHMAGSAFASPVAQPCTWMVVAASDNIAAAQRQAIEGVGANRHVINQTAAGVISGGTNAVALGPTAINWVGEPRIVIAEFNGVSSAMYVDGFTTARATANLGTITATGLRVGCFNGSSNFWSGPIAEVVLAVGASSTIRTNLARYAGARYGITVS